MLSIKTRHNLGIFNENKIIILHTLFQCSDYLCGCDLIARIEIPKNLLSYHIKSLRELGLIEETRCGQKKQYRITEDQREKVKSILTILEVI